MLVLVKAQNLLVDDECLICRQQRGYSEVPGGLLFGDALSVAYHCPPWNEWPVYLGHLLITPRNHAADFAALRPEEAASVGVAITRGSAALKQAGATRVYVATVGHGAAADHLHVHLMPRWADTPVGVAWHSVDEWHGARRGGPEEIEQFVEDLRPYL